MQGEERPWWRRRGERIEQALLAPRLAEDLARTGGVARATVQRVRAASKQAGVAARATAGKGGRRHQDLTLQQEHAFLQPFLARAGRGEMVTAAQIQRAVEPEAKPPVATSTRSRLLKGHGWRRRGPRSRPGEGPQGQRVQGHPASTPPHNQPAPPKGQLAQGHPVCPWRRRESSRPKAKRQLSAHGY
jgi:hypothetical protein